MSWTSLSLPHTTDTSASMKGRGRTTSCRACWCSRWSWSLGGASPWTASRTDPWPRCALSCLPYSSPPRCSRLDAMFQF